MNQLFMKDDYNAVDCFASPQYLRDGNPSVRILNRGIVLTFLLLCFVWHGINAQTFNYGTGSIAANPAGFNTAGTFTGYSITGNDLTVTGNINLPTGTYNFGSVTIGSGVTVTVTGNTAPLIIRCTGSFTNNGDLRAVSGNGGNATGVTGGIAGAAVAGGLNGGVGGAGGSGASGTTGPGLNFGTSTGRGLQGCGVSNTRPSWAGPGGGGGSYGTAGTNGGNATGVSTGCATGGLAGAIYGNAALTLQVGAAASYFSAGATAAGNRWILAGSSGAGGHGTQSILASARAAGGGGGASGGAVQIVANSVSIGSGAWIRCRGGNGGNGSVSSGGSAGGGGGGGGAGGTINIQYMSSYTNNGTLQVAGGISGSQGFGSTGTGGAGGSGGLGRTLVEQDVVLCTPPSTSASSFSASAVTTNSATLSWARGNGDQVLVIVREGAPVSGAPVSATSYTANASYPSGEALGGGRVVYIGSGSSVNVTGLPSVNTIYHVAVFEFFTAGGGCYQAVPNQLTGTFTTGDGPMTFLTSGVTQSSTAGMPLGSASQQIVQMQVNTGPGTVSPLEVTSLTFNTNGSTLSGTVGNDILAARILYNTTNSLSGAVQFGPDITSFPGGTNPIVVTGSQILQPNSNNYFFVVYDIRLSATTGNLLDAEITSLSYTNGVSTFNPVPVPVTAAGTRAITPLMSLSCGYTFSHFAPTWTSNVGQPGTTVIASGVGSIDDQRWPSQSFTSGFTFEFNGKVYNTFGIHSKGYIWFGSTNPSGLTFQAISSTLAYEGSIAPFAFDMVAHSASTTTPQVTVRYTGTAPNRVCIIEWTAFRPYNNTGGLCPAFSSPTDWNRYDFQLHLYENGGTNANRIEFVYRDMNGFCVNANGASAQVGLRGPANTDFLNRQGSGNAAHTASSAGTLNTQTITHGANNYFAGNGGMRFTPTFQIPTITPAPSASNSCPTETVTLSTASPVINRQWYNNDLPIAGATGLTYNADQSGNHVLMVNQGGCAKLSAPTNVTITVCRNITTSDLAGPSICAGVPVSVSFAVSGPFNPGNVFTAQLSDASGSFTSPVTIGTLTGINSGVISAGPGLIPAGTPPGLGYRIRVIGSNPSIVGSETSAFEVLEPAPVMSITNPPAGCLPLSPVDITATGVVNVTNGVVVNSTTYWNDAGATSAFTGNPAGVTSAGTIYVRKENGCGSDIKPVNVTFNNPVVSSHTSINPTTCAGTNGSITLNGLQPSTAYQVLYQRNGPPSINAGTITTNGAGGLVIANLQDGNYDNIVLTRSGCAAVIPYPASGQITLSDPSAPVITSFTTVNPTTCVSNDGSITLNGLLPSTAYAVSYDRNGTTVSAGTLTSNAGGGITLSGLLDGSYDNIFVGRLGCNSAPVPSVGFIDLNAPGAVAISSHVANNPTTCAGANGSILLSGLTPSSSYAVTYTRNGSSVNAGSLSTNGSGELTISGLNEANYANFVLTSGSGCVSPAYPLAGNISLVDPTAPSISGAIGNNPITCGGSDGSVVLSGLSPSLSYTVTYRRNNGATTNAGLLNSDGSGNLLISGLNQGDYDQIIVSRNGCSSSMFPVSGSISLFQPLTPAEPTGVPASVCGPDVVVLSATGATAGEDYNWYSALTGGSPLQNGGVAFGTPFLTSTTTYYVSMFNTVSGCESARVPVTATILALPAQPLITPSGSTAICIGSPITLTSSYLNGNTWSNGSTGNTINVSTAGNFSVTVTDLNGCSSSSAILSTTLVSCAAFTWTGAVSSDWDNPLNWSTGVLPDANTNVTFQLPVNFMPRIQTGVNGAVRDLLFGAGVTLTIDANQFLFISGNLSAPAGTNIAGDGIVRLNGTAQQTITGSITYPNLRIANNSGVVIQSGMQSIRAALELQNGQLTTNSLVRLLSTPTSTAYINDFSPGYTGSLLGNVNVRRFVAGGTGYRYLSSPMTLSSGLNVTNFGPFISGANNVIYDPEGDLNISGFPTAWVYHENDANAVESDNAQWGWVSATNASVPLEPLKGYAVNFTGNTTISLIGAVNTGAIGPIGITNTPSADPASDGYQLIGNPYPSPISWNALRNLATNTGQFTPVVKSWSNTGQYSGQYADFNGVVGTNGGNDFISIGQAVMIRRATPGAGSLSIDNSVRVAELNPVFFEEQEVPNRIRLRLIGGAGADEMVVYFDPQASDEYDSDKDAVKMLSGSPGVPNLYSEKGQNDFSINVLGAFNSRKEVPVGLNITQEGTYTLSASEFESFAPTSLLFLEDKQTGVFYNLRLQPSLSFEFSSGVFTDRFVLHFDLPLSTTVNAETCLQNDGEVHIQNPGQSTWQGELSQNGVQVNTISISGGETYAFGGLGEGEYTLSLQTEDGYLVHENLIVESTEGVNALFATPETEVNVNQEIEFSPNSVLNSSQYAWDFGDGNQSSQSNPVHVFATPGIYTVTLTVSNAECTSTHHVQISVLSPIATSINGLEDGNNALVVYPNPAQDIANIQFISGNVQNRETLEWLEMYDVTGRLVRKDFISGLVNADVFSFAVSELSPGVYTICLRGEKAQYTTKLSIQR